MVEIVLSAQSGVVVALIILWQGSSLRSMEITSYFCI